MKQKVRDLLERTFPTPSINNVIHINSINSHFEENEQKEVWIELIELKNKNKISIDDMITGNITILQDFYLN